MTSGSRVEDLGHRVVLLDTLSSIHSRVTSRATPAWEGRSISGSDPSGMKVWVHHQVSRWDQGRCGQRREFRMDSGVKAWVPVMPWDGLQWRALVYSSNLSLLSLPTRGWKAASLPMSGRLMWHRWGLGQPWSICLGSLRRKVFTSKGNPCLTSSSRQWFQKSSQHLIGPGILPRPPLTVTLQLCPTLDLQWQFPGVPHLVKVARSVLWLGPTREREKEEEEMMWSDGRPCTLPLAASPQRTTSWHRCYLTGLFTGLRRVTKRLCFE